MAFPKIKRQNDGYHSYIIISSSEWTALNPQQAADNFSFPQISFLFSPKLICQLIFLMSNRIQCKFFAHGACLKGECCEFAHDWNAPVNNICTFYQKGACSYGSRCRYDHVKISRPPKTVSSSSSSLPQTKSETNHLTHLGFSWNGEFKPVLSSPSEQSALANKSVWPENSENSASDIPICSFAAAGNCPHGDNCPHIHGDLCSICGKHCLHPFRPDEREQHIKTCEKNSKRIEALKRSQEIECSVCLDVVLSKPTAAERKFGLLSECDHPFCISCIRNWRNNSPSSGMDVNSTLRSCPICRKQSHFVIPSVIWYSSKEEKQEIIDSYKQKLKSIDCKYFDFGNGTCPFGTSCFYKHAYRDGSLEEVVLRHLNSEDGDTVIAKNVRLSDFLDRLHIGSF